MKQGQVRWYTFQAPDKRRPVLILTRNSAIRFLDALTVVPITTTIRDIPTKVALSRADGIRRNTVQIGRYRDSGLDNFSQGAIPIAPFTVLTEPYWD